MEKQDHPRGRTKRILMSQIHRGLKIEDAEISGNTLIPYTTFIHSKHPGVHDLLTVNLHHCLRTNIAFTGNSA